MDRQSPAQGLGLGLGQVDPARDPALGATLAESLLWRSSGRAQPCPGEPSVLQAGALQGCTENKHEPEVAGPYTATSGGAGGRGRGMGGPELPFLPLLWTASKQVLEAKEPSLETGNTTLGLKLL